MPPSKKALYPALLLAVVLLAGCASLPRPADELRFGLWASQRGLWEEAAFRWKQVLKTDPNSVAAHNNLGVAYERKGLFEEALREYETAFKLAPGNAHVKSNYTNCKESIKNPEPKALPKKAADAQK
jgi:Flp pilus assembly protein TadD